MTVGNVAEVVLEEAREALRNVDARRVAWLGAVRLLPAFTFPRVRTQLLRYAGPKLGERVAFLGPINVVGPPGSLATLSIDRETIVAPGVTLCLDAPITIGKGVSLGPGAELYTGTHDLGTGSQRMSPRPAPRPIVIEDGAWIGMNAVVLAGVRVGHGAVVAAGSVVMSDVPPDALVAGSPATVQRTLPFGDR